MITTPEAPTSDILQANSRLKAENERLENEHQRLLALDRLKTEFLARVSHDLRTPLNSIIGFSELMQAEVGSRNLKQHADYLSAINRNGRVLLVMINDLLDLSSLESGHLTLRREWASLATLVGDLRAATTPLLAERQIEVLWPDEEMLIGQQAYIDRRRLLQALINLVDNARKHAPVGGQITITMDASRRESHFTVADNGPGVPMDEQEQIFRPFFQRTPVPGVPMGVGLGLAIVKGIIERHEGRISITSGIGKGCRFQVTIPHGQSP